MKKIIVLTSLFLMVASQIAFAQISVDAFNDANDVTVDHLEDQRATFQDAINSADGSLIQVGTISADSLDDNANPVVRWDETFNDYINTGLLPATSVSLTGTTSSGTAYVEGVRVVKIDTNNLYTADKDTYVDISSNGTFTYSEVTQGGSAPAVAANSIRLARVSTDSTTVAGVEDLRVLSITLGTVAEIQDNDGDTVVSVETNSDEDKTRFFVGVANVKTEQFLVEENLIEPTNDKKLDLGTSSKNFREGHIDSINAGTIIVSNASPDTAVSIIKTAELSTLKNGLFVGSTVAQGNSSLVRIHMSVDTSTANVVEIKNDGDGCALNIIADKDLASGKNALVVSSNVQQTNDSLVKINQDTASSTQPAVEVANDGTGAGISTSCTNVAPNMVADNTGNGSHLRFTGDPTVASPVDGDFWFDGNDLKIRVGVTTFNIDVTAE